MLTYKAQLVGIRLNSREDWHTSKRSFLDFKPIKNSTMYVGQRIKHGLIKAYDGRKIKGDLNRSDNNTKKAIPNAFRNEIEGITVCPPRFNLVN
jgi:hypothetical protein